MTSRPSDHSITYRLLAGVLGVATLLTGTAIPVAAAEPTEMPTELEQSVLLATEEGTSPTPLAGHETPIPVPSPVAEASATPVANPEPSPTPTPATSSSPSQHDAGAPVRVIANAQAEVEAAGSTISGTVTAGGYGAPGISVSVYSWAPSDVVVASGTTTADGTFTTTPALPVGGYGGYKIRFDGDERYEGLGWWAGNGQISPNSPASVTVDGVNPLVGIDPSVVHKSLVTGTLATEGGRPIKGVSLTLTEAKYGYTTASATVLADGSFNVQIRSGGNPGPGTYYVSVSGLGGLLSGYYASTQPGKWVPDKASSTPIVLTGVDRDLGRITIPLPREVTGTVVEGSTPVAVGVALVGTGETMADGAANIPDGTFSLVGTPTRPYRLRVTSSDTGIVGYYALGAPGHFSTDPAAATTITPPTPLTELGVIDLAASGPVDPPTPTDTTSPTVTTTTPDLGATGVARNAMPRVTFSEPVVGVASDSMMLVDQTAGAMLGATVTYDAASRTATIRPAALLPAGHVIRIRPGTIKDAAGNWLPGQIGTFTVTTDGTKPTIAGRTPSSGATGVSRSANVLVRFSETVRGTSASTVRLRDTKTGSYTSATVTYSATTKRVTLNPKTTLAGRRKYSVIISSGITDAAGNPLTSTSWSFTTRS